MGDSAVVDLVCGPASPLAETFQRYRLVARLGAGGQADVYRGVRLCGGVTSTAVTVKVFRMNPKRAIADELRSWDKGDAALMDLNTRGVPGICRRVDGFYGPPPHTGGAAPSGGDDAVPYQVYDYLHGVNLRDYVTSKAGFGAPNRLNATTALATLAESLKAMHEPDTVTVCPVLHMDVKPSNIMVLTNGETRLIDFTGARYWRSAEITQIAYTPESGGPEALNGQVSPAYDVHGFGAVAFYLIAGVAPRGSGAPPMDKHDVFRGRPALRDHMLSVLADRPEDRPTTDELAGWTQTLAQLVRASHVPDVGLDWSDKHPWPAAQRAVGRARPALTGTETDAFTRIEALERELVALRAKAGVRPPVNGALAPRPVAALPVPTSPASPPAPNSPAAAPRSRGPASASSGPASASPRPPAGPPAIPAMIGRAQVVARAPERSGYAAPEGAFIGGGYPSDPPAGARVSRRPSVNLRTLRRGGGWTMAGACFAVACWFVWAAANRKSGAVLAPGFLVATVVVAVGLFIVLRLLGRVVIEGWMHKTRRGARGAHLGTAAFLFGVGVTFLQETSWVMSAYHWLKGL